MEPISEALRELLVRQELRGKTAGTVMSSRMREPGAADEGARRQVAADREEHGGVLMLISNGARVVECAPWLMIIDGGKE